MLVVPDAMALETVDALPVKLTLPTTERSPVIRVVPGNPVSKVIKPSAVVVFRVQSPEILSINLLSTLIQRSFVLFM